MELGLDDGLTADEQLVLELGSFILAFISGLFLIYSVVRFVKVAKEGFTKVVRGFFAINIVATTMRFGTFLALGMLVIKKSDDIVIKNDPTVINHSAVSNLLSLIWVFPDIFPLINYILLQVIWIQVLYGGHADFRPSTFRSRDPINYAFALIMMFGFSTLQVLFCFLFMFEVIALQDLEIQIAVASLVVVAITIASMVILCLKFSGIPYRSHLLVDNLKCLLYVLILWGTARIIYGIITIAYPDTIQSNPNAVGVVIAMTAEYVALELIPYLIALDSKSINALALKTEPSDMATLILPHPEDYHSSGSQHDGPHLDTDQDSKRKASLHHSPPFLEKTKSATASAYSSPGLGVTRTRTNYQLVEEKKTFKQRSSLKETAFAVGRCELASAWSRPPPAVRLFARGWLSRGTARRRRSSQRCT